MLGHHVVEHDEIRFKEIHAAQIPVQNLREKRHALQLHVFLRSDTEPSVLETRIIVRVDSDRVECPEVNPLTHKIRNETLGPFVG